ncbi:hypothetical protein J3E72DRAFT_273756 [Bipolaris maydis]|nr:hypothetical protein J3E72DRAFT_273756 [Bipolaris maydis]
MVTTTTTTGHADAPRIFIRGFKPGCMPNISKQLSLVMKTHASNIAQNHEVCPQSPMAHISTTIRISSNNDVSPCPSHGDTSEEEVTIEPDSGDKIDENAIESSDDELWEDDNDEEGGPHSVAEPLSFPRVKSEPNLASRRSLLTSAFQQDDCALTLANTPSYPPPGICGSRIQLPKSPSTSNSPQEDSGRMTQLQESRTRCIIMPTSNVHPPVMSPRTTRQNMLTSELTSTLRQSLLGERQQKNVITTNPGTALRRAMTTGDIEGLNNNIEKQQQPLKSSAAKDDSKPEGHYNQFFVRELDDYHSSGW